MNQFRRCLSILVASAVLAGCATPEPTPPAPRYDQLPGRIVQLLPPTLADRTGWAADIHAAFVTQAIPPTIENVCAVLAITEQESGFRADPSVPNLPAIAWREIDARADRAGIPKMVVHATLQISSSDGRSYSERIDTVKTERELSEIFEDFIARVPLGTRLFAKLNPVRTGGPMQVSVAFAETHAAEHKYPYPVAISIRREVFTRRGGMYFGIAHLLGYPAQYSEPLYRFADFNAGRYASRNAAFQGALGRLSGMTLTLDGDLIPPAAGKDAPPGETERAALAVAHRLGLGAAAIRQGLEQGESAAFEGTALYERVYAQADRAAGKALPRAVIPDITLKSPKITRKLTTEWFARRVDERYRRCLAKSGVATVAPPTPTPASP